MSGSPFDVSVSAGPARGANATATGTALALATAGENSTFLIQARDLQSNAASEGSAFPSSYNDTGREEGTVFNVTMTRNADVLGWGEEEEGQDSDNSTVVHATVENLGESNSRLRNRCRLVYKTREYLSFLARHGDCDPPCMSALELTPPLQALSYTPSEGSVAIG